ncbi:MAG: FkbM family methyltransferase [Azoarcus sp.]|jgi:FkbM family methyltransferase|nr:FkbM family methyltransferase [Azoarcus sp.]
MSVHAVERVKQLMDCLVNQAITPLVAACEEIEQVERWLEDSESLTQYRNFLALSTARGVLDGSTAVHYLGNFKADAWQRARDRTRILLASGAIPTLEFPPGAAPDLLVICTFVIEQYRYGEMVAVREGDVFLDCGACCGETALWAEKAGAGKVWSFEPNPEALDYMSRNIQKHGQGRIEPVPLGLSAAPGQMNMERYPTNIGGTRLVAGEHGALTVPVVTLDDWCRENKVKPDFIKMDLEGAEVDVLNGARGVIMEHKPKLAICLYHRLADMWVIPRLIKEMVPEYRFWCRENAPTGEFVLYATVDKRQ